MTRPKNRRELTADEIQIIQLVARGLTNAQICQRLGVRMPTVQARVRAANWVIGMQSGKKPERGRAAMCRVEMVIWAYENGLVGAQAKAEREQALTGRAFSVLRQLVHKRPYPIVREQAVALVREVDAEATAELHEIGRAA